MIRETPTSSEWFRSLPLPDGADTPVAMVDLDRVVASLELVRAAAAPLPVRIAFALKASYLRPVVEAVRSVGGCASVFSQIELDLARRAGFRPSDIVFNGVGRSGTKLVGAAIEGVHVVVESMDELDALVAHASGRRIGIGVRVNAAGTPAALSSEKYDVLGIPIASLGDVADRLERTEVRVVGVGFHAFGNATEATGHLALLRELVPALQDLNGHVSVSLEHVDVGGGFASRFRLADEQARHVFGSVARAVFDGLGVPTIFELGRFLVADAQVVVATVVAVRQRQTGGAAVILDVTTNYLIPAPGHDFHIALVEEGGRGVLHDTTFFDRLGSEICRHAAAAMTPGTRVFVRNVGAYAGVMKEQFVFETPRHWFHANGAIESEPESNIDVGDYHGWQR